MKHRAKPRRLQGCFDFKRTLTKPGEQYEADSFGGWPTRLDTSFHMDDEYVEEKF